MTTKQVVIIGGGFAGINLAKHLSDKSGFNVTLADKNNYNFFPPLLYQVATGFLEASNISYPFRKMFQGKKNIRFRMGELLKVVPQENKVVLSSGDLEYDYLVLATGTESNYFGLENVKANAIPMKTVNDALEMRNYLLQQLENATLTPDKTEREKLLTIVIAGGGPTGVEVSGMLAEMRKFIIRKDYPEFRGAKDQSHIYLIDGGPQLLSPMSPRSQKDTYTALCKLGVEIKLNIQVKDYINDMVVLSNGEHIQTKTLIWAAGVSAKTIAGIPGTSYGRGKRLLTDAFNKVQNTSNIYAIGDTCLQTSDPDFPEGHPQVAQVALQQGKNLAINFRRIAAQQPLRPFRYRDKGTMAIIGRNKAVADLPKPPLHFRGFIAWFMWLFIHLISLVTYRNKITTLYNWMIAYFTKDQALRMIIRPLKKE
ncbi:NAD(P)/FAD-dependent oxidoreductase [Agriterribacter sp.]|uniref:NAD(P)/FAD-dependent oxidoreductase n=1 Tax=Agriterribacter sp. TaxID=2821509 RepID=UPI002B814082|nr:NAD(P)/FAD-dependent oxidoreductase [Agriterribacter sp.]HRO45669.1 NAD(P)/FAD-dependent oxidoreductase [Agriterribacter sp.]HRQ15853.1 NAD(P)/FAD-dependent oxidoreductase [Agriterribacter sp.]